MLSTHAIESMGFKPIPAGETIEAAFHSLHVFEVRGFLVQDGCVVSHNASASGADYILAIGASVNDVCKSMVGDVLTEDEEAWAKEHKCTSPYAVVHFGPTSRHAVTNGHVKTEQGKLLTYDLFGAAKKELRRLEEALPSIEMALACAFSSGGQSVQFKPIDRTVYGVTTNNIAVHDIRITGSASAYTSKPLVAAEIDSGIKRVEKLAGSLDPRVSRFFQLGLRDQDDLKKFLYYFLAIEIEVHRVFRTVPAAQHIQNGATFDPRVSTSLAGLIENRNNWTNLADQFIWCVASSWKHLTDDDIKEFKRLKRVRDGIAHGDISSPDGAAVIAVESLAKKLHS